MQFAAIALLLIYAADRTSPGYPAYQKANALFVSKKFPESLAAVEEALRLDPNLIPALTLRAKMAMSLNRFDVSRESLEHALQVDPTSQYARFLYGLNFYLSNDLQLALPQFQKARQLQPSDPRAALYLGLTYESLGRTTEAMTLYEEAAHLDPQPETYLTGARLLLLLGRFDDCEHWLRQALKLNPTSRECHFELARLFLKKADPADAAKEGDMALAIAGTTPSDAQIHYLLIRAYRDSNPARSAKHAEAVRALEAKKN